MKRKQVEVYMKFAELLASQSSATKRKVGAVIAKANQGQWGVIAEGYNGTPPGWSNVCELDGHTKPEVIHAEANAMDKLCRSTESSVGAHLITTTAPCSACALRILNIGLTKVWYREQYRNEDGLEFLRRAGIEVEQI